MADMLKNGLNDMLAQNEIPGCVSGIASCIWLRLGVDHECDREVCILSPQETEIIDHPGRKTQLELAMMNHGIHAGTRFIVMAAHTETDIQDTVSATEKALIDLRNQGMI